MGDDLDDMIRGLRGLQGTPIERYALGREPPRDVLDGGSPADRLKATLELCAFGIGMTRARLAREHPGVPPEELARLLAEWMLERPGAEHGDGVGRLRPWPPASL